MSEVGRQGRCSEEKEEGRAGGDIAPQGAHGAAPGKGSQAGGIWVVTCAEGLWGAFGECWGKGWSFLYSPLAVSTLRILICLRKPTSYDLKQGHAMNPRVRQEFPHRGHRLG